MYIYKKTRSKCLQESLLMKNTYSLISILYNGFDNTLKIPEGYCSTILKSKFSNKKNCACHCILGRQLAGKPQYANGKIV